MSKGISQVVKITEAKIHTTKGAITSTLRYTLCISFLFAGVLKLISITSFYHEVELFLLAYFPTFLHGYVKEIGISVCIAEIAMALLGLWEQLTRYICLGFLLMLSFFTWLTCINLFFPSPIGSVESCGCFGEFFRLSPLHSFLKNVVLWLLSLTYFLLTRHKTSSWRIPFL